MLDIIRTALWNQFGAAIQTLENAITACPEAIWADRSAKPQYWFLAYHTIFWLDLYLSDTYESFVLPAPFTLNEMDDALVFPEKPYTKEELLTYLAHCRTKFHAKIEALTEETARQRFVLESMDYNVVELMLYNMRHVQHHAAQLNLILRQRTDSAPGWVSGARNRREWVG